MTDKSPADPRACVICASLASLIDDLEFAQIMIERGDVRDARSYAINSATVFVESLDREGASSSAAIGSEKGAIQASIRIKGPRSSFSGTLRTVRQSPLPPESDAQ